MAQTQSGINPDVISEVAKNQYLSITRKAGMSDDIALETYEDHKESADKLTDQVLANDIKKGDLANKLKKLSNSETPHSSVTKAAINGDAQDVGGVAGARLKSFFERIERLNEEKSDLAEDIKEVFAEAKGVGFDVKIMRKIITLRKMDGEKRREEEELLDLYKTAVNMI